MMKPHSTVGVFGPCPDRADLPKLLEQAKLMAVVKEAHRAIFAYLWDTHLAFIQKHARQDWGNKISTQSLAHDVVTEMLDGIESFTDIEHVCSSFRQRIMGRAIDHQRQRVRQQEAADRLSYSLSKRDPQSHTEELERLDLVQRMIQALSRTQSQLGSRDRTQVSRHRRQSRNLCRYRRGAGRD